MTKILTGVELADIRARLERGDGWPAGGFTWRTIVSLCDTVDELQKQLTEAREMANALETRMLMGRT